jgi:1,4-dihydroxy-2-naphthoate octaprenyltransferase
MSEPAWMDTHIGGVLTPVRVWIQGARPKTLGAAIAPVLVGTAAGTTDGPIRWGRAVAALVVALALQVGVNYANDYSDGVRGTDKNRRGPVRLVAGGLASPAAVRNASAIAFAVAAIVGGVLSLVVNPWLLVVGLAALIAAVTYTGGPKPYGYLGLGEVMVLAFFGFVATVGSAYVQYRQLPGVAWWGALAVGLPACAILLANNVRDVETDSVAQKRTLAVRFGAPRARLLFAGCMAGALLAVVGCGVLHPWALLALAAAPLAITPIRLVRTRSDPPSLVAALLGTVRFQLALAVLLAVGLWIG